MYTWVTGVLRVRAVDMRGNGWFLPFRKAEVRLAAGLAAVHGLNDDR